MSVKTEWNMCCPSCGEDDEIDITAQISVRLFSDGTDPDASRNGDLEWDDTSTASCGCGFSGTVADFDTQSAAKAAHLAAAPAPTAIMGSVTDLDPAEVMKGLNVQRIDGSWGKSRPLSPRLAVVLARGLYQAIVVDDKAAFEDTEVLVIDYDTEGASEGETLNILQDDGLKAEAFARIEPVEAAGIDLAAAATAIQQQSS